MASETMIRMHKKDLTQLPRPALPEGYAIRRFQPGEEMIWGRLLHENGELGAWDRERVEKAFGERNGRVWKESIHFVVWKGEPVATACIQLHDDHPDLPELGWVSVSPKHRGRRLGEGVSLSVLHFMAQSGYRHCFLQTHAHRLAAIRIYLDLGFKPYADYERYDPEDWKEVFAGLNQPDTR